VSDNYTKKDNGLGAAQQSCWPPPVKPVLQADGVFSAQGSFGTAQFRLRCQSIFAVKSKRRDLRKRPLRRRWQAHQTAIQSELHHQL